MVKLTKKIARDISPNYYKSDDEIINSSQQVLTISRPLSTPVPPKPIQDTFRFVGANFPNIASVSAFAGDKNTTSRFRVTNALNVLTYAQIQTGYGFAGFSAPLNHAIIIWLPRVYAGKCFQVQIQLQCSLDAAAAVNLTSLSPFVTVANFQSTSSGGYNNPGSANNPLAFQRFLTSTNMLNEVPVNADGIIFNVLNATPTTNITSTIWITEVDPMIGGVYNVPQVTI